jgi:RNA polymerase sigma factor (sigma-70 family)
LKSKRHYTEEESIALLKSKGEEAFSVLYDNYSAALYGVISKIVIAEEIAEDVLQETFVKIWKNSSFYDPSKGRLFTWMLNIARNMAIDTVRSKQFQVDKTIQKIDNSVGIPENSHLHVFSATDHIGIKEVVEHLNPDHKVIIDMAYFGGYTQDEISKELNIPLGTVKTRSRMALGHLRALLKTQ